MADRPKIDEFVFVLLAGLVLIITFMVGFPSLEQREGNATANITGTTSGDTVRFMKLGDFTVSYSLGTEVLERKADFEVNKGYFGEQQATLTGDVTSDKLSLLSGATITINVDSTNGKGPLIVLVNGQEVYNKVVGAGAFTIDIDRAIIKPSNTVTIMSDYSSWAFWDKSKYDIKSAKFEIQYQGSSFKDFTFKLDENEFDNFKFGRLTFLLADDETISPTNKLKITINGDRFFYDIPPLVSFSRDIIKPFMRLGLNRISFEADPTATYSLQDVTVTIVSSK